VKAKPDYINARIGLGSALARLERMDEAIAEFQRALDIDGNSVEAHCSLGKALAQQGRIEEAVSQYRDALKIDGDDLSALNDLAWLRATYPQAAFRNAAETIRLAEHALELSNGRGPNATVLDTLAAAYANAGRFAEASQAGRRALDLATLQGNPALAQKIMARLRLYMAKKPYRQPAHRSPPNPTAARPDTP
jgi:protein O-mannosyl-transferase